MHVYYVTFNLYYTVLVISIIIIQIYAYAYNTIGL